MSNRYRDADLARDQAQAGVTVTLPGRGLPVISGLHSRPAAAAMERILARQGHRAKRPAAGN
jgi:hypothetical protein